MLALNDTTAYIHENSQKEVTNFYQFQLELGQRSSNGHCSDNDHPYQTDSLRGEGGGGKAKMKGFK